MAISSALDHGSPEVRTRHQSESRLGLAARPRRTRGAALRSCCSRGETDLSSRRWPPRAVPPAPPPAEAPRVDPRNSARSSCGSCVSAAASSSSPLLFAWWHSPLAASFLLFLCLLHVFFLRRVPSLTSESWR
ncbi:unnamed protein product [Prorocentrum cordatum]|uniref:Uncharacterized protein n=1 Tax=Prorocentrum cordatum TaxID=2364126 RepID=A0ABN9QYY1_9DINO|nr:unnamed protein product [Polarella glacialis]